MMPAQSFRNIQILNGPFLAGGYIVTNAPDCIQIDGTGLDILPGLVDVHGDAFERALAPRPGVMVPIPIALAELEAQLLAAGITTAFLAITLSWEAGLRSIATYEALRDAISSRPKDSVPDIKLHVRFEAFNLPAIDLLIADINRGIIGMVSFNDHTPGILRKLNDPASLSKFSERAGQSLAAFSASAYKAAEASPSAIATGQTKLSAAARAANIPMASHDDASITARATFRQLHATISEFPITLEVARDAISHNEDVVMGAPNVVRGGSHMGWHGAEALVKEGLCTVLCSDYHYPSLLHAPYRIVANGSASFEKAIALVTENAAGMALLHDRGTLDIGGRADIILVDPGADRVMPLVLMTIIGGKLAYVAPDAVSRLSINATSLVPASSILRSFVTVPSN